MIHVLISLFLILGAQLGFIPFAESAAVLAAMNFVLACMFYYLIVGLIIGTKSLVINTNIDIGATVAFKVVEFIALWFLYTNGYEVVAAFSLPAVLTTTFTDLFSILCKLDIVELEVEEDDNQ